MAYPFVSPSCARDDLRQAARVLLDQPHYAAAGDCDCELKAELARAMQREADKPYPDAQLVTWARQINREHLRARVAEAVLLS